MQELDCSGSSPKPFSCVVLKVKTCVVEMLIRVFRLNVPIQILELSIDNKQGWLIIYDLIY